MNLVRNNKIFLTVVFYQCPNKTINSKNLQTTGGDFTKCELLFE